MSKDPHEFNQIKCERLLVMVMACKKRGVMLFFDLTLRCMFEFFCFEVCCHLFRVSDLLLCLLHARLRVFLFKCVCVIVLVQSRMLATNALQNLNHWAYHLTNSRTLKKVFEQYV